MHKRMSPHGDKDHIGEAIPIIQHFKVKRIN